MGVQYLLIEGINKINFFNIYYLHKFPFYFYFTLEFHEFANEFFSTQGHTWFKLLFAKKNYQPQGKSSFHSEGREKF